ncbi:DUF2306 domain-containing protein [uncultured Croceitalea sp.]|uniref:DUF2306 domain-containing protein n=1 Tax=uncultured Croceitalea sp. TaxID=1798908 RepID=UPI003305C93B
MNFMYIITDTTGLVHTIASVISLFAGTYVLFAKKGTKTHKKVGYSYIAAMTVVLVTSFMMYNLFGGFGIFHIFAIVSSLTILAGMVPIIRKKPRKYISFHYSFMYWSVIGLYGAFMAEILTRIPKMVIDDQTILPIFFNMVGVAVFIVMAFGYYIMFRKKKAWEKFDKNI